MELFLVRFISRDSSSTEEEERGPRRRPGEKQGVHPTSPVIGVTGTWTTFCFF
jgi:hypothetical protein